MPELQEEQIPVYQPQPTPPKWLLIAGGFVTILLLFGLGFWLGKGKPLPPKPTPIDPGQVLADRFSQPVAAPGQITFIFFVKRFCYNISYAYSFTSFSYVI